MRWTILRLTLLTVVGILFALMLVFAIPYVRRISPANLTSCNQNLSDIATALEMYSSDWAGKYPTSLATLTPNYLRASPNALARLPLCRTPSPRSRLTACRSNIKSICFGLEMYATDNAGEYPTALNQLTPNYLPALPECPAATTNSYVAAFGRFAPLNPDRSEDYYYVECHGENHAEVGVAPNFPAWACFGGPLDGPAPNRISIAWGK